MALPSLIKFIYNHGTEEVIKRGKKIFLTNGVQKLKIDEFAATASFRVRNDVYQNFYTVNINRFNDEAFLNVRCQCPYNMGEICRHEVAALFYLNELIETNQLTEQIVVYDQSMTQVRMHQIDIKSLKQFNSAKNFTEAGEISLHNPAIIEHAANELVKATFNINNEQFHVTIRRNDDKSFTTSCNCDEKDYVLCKHKTALFLQLVNAYGASYFDTIRNWDAQKNKLLQQYGYSLDDDLSGKFEFTYVQEKPILRVLDPSIKKIGFTPSVTVPEAKAAPKEADQNTRLGIVIDANYKSLPHFSVHLIKGEWDNVQKSYIDKVTTIDSTKYIALDDYTDAEKSIIAQVRKLLPKEIDRYLARNSQYGDLWENVISEDLISENKRTFFDYVHQRLFKIFELIGDRTPLYFIARGKKFTTQNLERVFVSSNKLHAKFVVEGKNSNLKISGNLYTRERTFDPLENKLDNSLLYHYDQNLYLIASPTTAYYIDTLILNKPEFKGHELLEKILLPLSKVEEVDFRTDIFRHEEGNLEGILIRFSENTDHFILKPIFKYQEHLVEWDGQRSIQITNGQQIRIINRDTQSEEAWIEQLCKVNEFIRTNPSQGYLYIHAKYLLHGNTFYKLFEKLKEWNISLTGFDQLKKFKIRSSKPTTLLSISSGQDWFDTEVNMEFDGIQVSIDEIRKSLQKKQNVVALNDGTYGLLPEEWLKKYGLLFKMGEIQGTKLKISKFNFAIIDELYDAIDDEAVQKELEEKKRLIAQVDPQALGKEILPQGLVAELRPYQHSGYDWLQYLYKVGWGGLLADDMGLGKTIQALSLIQYVYEQNKNIKVIVVCPTTLLFNWRTEIEKFTPDLSKFIHHGMARPRKYTELDPYNLVITTYGTLRSDIELLNKIEWDYVILDESQAIKNPNSKVTKAAMVLNAKNRLALSGTPLQNNTFDLYAQMNFLNPGMLGNKEFFKDHFAIPIDKFQESSTKEHLRKLIFPFLLRRTKEQVAKDLPDKTEITLYCEMLPEQRKIYEAFRNDYRAKILGTIEQAGIEKSQLTILQGLTKLRQICDSPAILKDSVVYENHSVKLNELVRELEENLSDHKVLIFSQFLGMLNLIREKLNELNINYEYFDGSFTSKQRQVAINNFQNNSDCKVFLISLKAGGTGLNLTAADYVYIMDPWWNPAVEQQAIDRTHRIGQTKNIFAYKFICKDTVEEKIVKLKQKKNALVRDIIADDDGFVKNLTKEDVAYLFS